MEQDSSKKTEHDDDQTITFAQFFDGVRAYRYVVGESTGAPDATTGTNKRPVVSIERGDAQTVTVTRDDGEQYTFAIGAGARWTSSVDPLDRPLDEQEIRAAAMYQRRIDNGEDVGGRVEEWLAQFMARAVVHEQTEAIQAAIAEIVAKLNADESLEGPIVRDDKGRPKAVFRDDDGNPISPAEMAKVGAAWNAEGVDASFVEQAESEQIAEPSAPTGTLSDGDVGAQIEASRK